jgi:hypothetical protein
MEEKEFNNIYAIPANYTDSGRLMGGMLEIRNTVEAIILVGVIGYPELMWLPIPGTMKIVVMTVTLLPLGILALMGIAGDSLFQYAGHMIRHWTHRRKLHYRRIGYRYASNPKDKSKKKNRKKKQLQKRSD